MNALYNIMEHWKNLTCYQSLWSICLGYVVAVHQLTVDYLFFFVCLYFGVAVQTEIFYFSPIVRNAVTSIDSHLPA